jgi:hypothetical protein
VSFFALLVWPALLTASVRQDLARDWASFQVNRIIQTAKRRLNAIQTDFLFARDAGTRVTSSKFDL